MSESNDEYDSPWKEALEFYFEEFVKLFFPKIHSEIDWTKNYEFLDKELQKIVRDAELGLRLADKLVKVWTKDGEETWVLAHIEVQGEVEAGFDRRMYVYNYRIFDKYGRMPVSLAVLADDSKNWRPATYKQSKWGCGLKFWFPVVKLVDYNEHWKELEGSKNRFAPVVMAHIKAKSTRNEPETRLQWKLRIVRGLYEQGFSKRDIMELFRYIDWMMRLPQEME